MNHATRLRTLAFCCLLSLGFATAAFALPKPTVVTMADEPEATIEAGVCNIGELRVGNQGLIGPFEQGAAFYQLLDPQSCTQCSDVTGRAVLNAVIRLRFAFPCSALLRASIVGATAGPGGCYSPNPGQLLCPPAERVISESASQPSAKNYTVPLSGCCIEGPAFLVIEVVQSDCGPQSVVMPYTTAACTPCSQYASSPTYLPPGILEQCNDGFHRDFRMWVEADCCGVTPTLRDTWSRVKTLYR